MKVESLKCSILALGVMFALSGCSDDTKVVDGGAGGTGGVRGDDRDAGDDSDAGTAKSGGDAAGEADNGAGSCGL